MNELNDDCLLSIFDALEEWVDCVALSTVSRRFNALSASDVALWQRLSRRMDLAPLSVAKTIDWSVSNARHIFLRQRRRCGQCNGAPIPDFRLRSQLNTSRRNAAWFVFAQNFPDSCRFHSGEFDRNAVCECGLADGEFKPCRWFNWGAWSCCHHGQPCAPFGCAKAYHRCSGKTRKTHVVFGFQETQQDP